MKFLSSFSAFVICLTAFNPFSAFALPQNDIKNLAHEINSNMRAAHFASCAGMSLVLSCGNFVCERNKNENEQTCPADCVLASVRSYNQQTLCGDVKFVSTPSTEGEVQTLVLNAAKNRHHVKVIGNSHSANNILCTDGMVIATEKLNKIFGVEKFEGEDTVRLQPGVTLAELTDWLSDRGLSIGYSVMGFKGVSIAGAISTGSHGSSTKHTAVISNIVKSLSVVGADGQIRNFSEGTSKPTEWKAVKTSFGLLGVITEIRLKTFEQKNLEVNVTYGGEEDFLTKSNPFDLVKDCDWGQINWFPGAKSYMKSCGTETTKPAQKAATNRLVDPAFPGLLANPIKQVMQYASCNPAIGCVMDKMRSLQLRITPPFEYENNRGRKISSNHVVGPSHHMMSSALTPLQKGFFQMDWEIAVPRSRAIEALKAVKEHIVKNNICLPLVGVFLRFAPSENKTLMAHTVSGGDFVENEPVIFIEMPVYLPTGFSTELNQEYDRPYEEFARLLINKYSGRAHWGKNRDWVFGMQNELKVYGENAVEFNRVVKEMDPHGLFSNKFSENLGIQY